VAKLEAAFASAPLRKLFALGLLLCLSGNWSLPLLDRDEPRFAEASREMLQNHDFIIPRFNGAYRFDKPPLIYWCQAAAFRVLGDNAFAARLPSAIFAAATGVLIAFWGQRLGNQRAGTAGALMFLCCVQVLIHGRMSVADMPMIFFFCASAWTGWELSRSAGPAHAGWWSLLTASLALGFLAKGPVAWLPILGVILAILRRPKAARISILWIVVSLLASIALLAIWAVPALVSTRGEFLAVGIGRHVIHRSFGIMEGHGLGGLLGYLLLIPTYFVTLFFSFAPWAFKFPSALRAWWPQRAEDDFGCYLLLQVIIVFGVFSLVRTKLPHYTLPAFPCLALWLALRGETNNRDSLRSTTKIASAVSCVALVVTLCAFPVFKRHLVAAKLWEQARAYVRPDTKLVISGFGEPSLVWEFRGVTTNFAEYVRPEEVGRKLEAAAPLCVIAPTEYLSKHGIAPPSDAIVCRAEGVDSASFKRRHLSAFIRGEGSNPR
jgi:4-amino-4-deoxy-L-arabinose transferase-like glycosyltransferase